MEYRVRLNILSGAIVVALGIAVSVITSTVVASRAYQSKVKQAASARKDVSVKGSARTRVRSDLAVWKITVKGEGKELKGAFDVLEEGIARVHSFLVQRGFGASEVALSPIDTETFYVKTDKGADTREVSSYALDRVFTVTTAEVERVDAAAGEVTQLLRDNVVVVSAKPAYYYTKAADIKVQILGDASKDAKMRADEIAKSSGCRVAEVRQAQMGIIQITQPNSTEVQAYGVYDTTTIEKDVSVVVTLTLGLEN